MTRPCINVQHTLLECFISKSFSGCLKHKLLIYYGILTKKTTTQTFAQTYMHVVLKLFKRKPASIIFKPPPPTRMHCICPNLSKSSESLYHSSFLSHHHSAFTPCIFLPQLNVNQKKLLNLPVTLTLVVFSSLEVFMPASTFLHLHMSLYFLPQTALQVHES